MNDTIDGIFEPFDSYVKDQLELRKTILSDERARKGGVKDESVATVDYDTEIADTEYAYDILINDKKYSPDVIGNLEGAQKVSDGMYYPNLTSTGRREIDQILDSLLNTVVGTVIEHKVTQEQFFALTTEKQAVIRMVSGVDLKKSFKNELEPHEGYLLDNDGQGLAKQYILEGGTPFYNKKGDYLGVREGFLEPTYQGANVGIEEADKKRGFTYGDRNVRANPDDGYGIVPMPGITNAEIRTKSPNGSLREAKIEFHCHNRRQLEVLEMLYMRPGYPIMIEWGWSPFVSSDSFKGGTYGTVEELDMSETLTDFFNKNNTLNDINVTIRNKKRECSGNYDGFVGFCKNFSFKNRADGGYDCTTEVIAHGEILESLKSKKIFTNVSDNPQNAQGSFGMKSVTVNTTRYYLPVPMPILGAFFPLTWQHSTVDVNATGSYDLKTSHTEADDSFLFHLKSIKANLDKAGDSAFLQYHRGHGDGKQEDGRETLPDDTGNPNLRKYIREELGQDFDPPQFQDWDYGDPMPYELGELITAGNEQYYAGPGAKFTQEQREDMKEKLLDQGWVDGVYRKGYKYELDDGNKYDLWELNYVEPHYLEGFNNVKRLYSSITKKEPDGEIPNIVEPINLTPENDSDLFLDSKNDGGAGPGDFPIEGIPYDFQYDGDSKSNGWEKSVNYEETFIYKPINMNTGTGRQWEHGRVEWNYTNYEGIGIRSMLGGTILRQITKKNMSLENGPGDIRRTKTYKTEGIMDTGYRKHIYIRWDMLCQMMNHLSTEQYAPGEPLVEFTYASPNIPLTELSASGQLGYAHMRRKMGLDSYEDKDTGRTPKIKDHYIPYAVPKSDALDPTWDASTHTNNLAPGRYDANGKYHPLIGQSFNHNICLMPHMPMFDNLMNEGYTMVDEFAFEAYNKRQDGSYGYEKIHSLTPDSYDRPMVKIGLRAERKKPGSGMALLELYGTWTTEKKETDEGTFYIDRSSKYKSPYRPLSTYANLKASRHSIGYVYFNLDHLIKRYSEMSQESTTEEDITGDKTTTIRFKEDFNFLKFVSEIWNDVNSACAGVYDFQVSSEHERPNVVRVIDRTISGQVKSLYEFDPQGLQSVTRDLYYDTSIDKDMASMISIAAQAPNNVSNLQSLSFRAFHKNIKNRFTDASLISKDEDDRRNKMAAKQLQQDVNSYVKTIDGLFLYMDRLNSGNFEVDYTYDDTYKEYILEEKIIGPETAIRFASTIEEMKNNILLRHPLTGSDGNPNEGPTKSDPKRPWAGTANPDSKFHRNAIIPLNFNIKMDGISGIVPLQMFKINKYKLPIGYQDDRIAFIVSSENHKITAGQDWTVELGGQLVFTGGPSTTGVVRNRYKPPEAPPKPPEQIIESKEKQLNYEDEKVEGLMDAQGDTYNLGWVVPHEHYDKFPHAKYFSEKLGRHTSKRWKDKNGNPSSTDKGYGENPPNPKHGKRFTTPWGQLRVGNKGVRRHQGTDLYKGKNYSSTGEKHIAPFDGKIRFARKVTSGQGNGCGGEIIIDHYKSGPRDEHGYLINKEFDGRSTRFCHLIYDGKGKEIHVQKGQEVVRGQHFAWIGGGKGTAGRGGSTGPHGHYQVQLQANLDCNFDTAKKTSFSACYPGWREINPATGKITKSWLDQFAHPNQPDWWQSGGVNSHKLRYKQTYKTDENGRNEGHPQYDSTTAIYRYPNTHTDDPAYYFPKEENPSGTTKSKNTTRLKEDSCDMDLVMSEEKHAEAQAEWLKCETEYKGIHY